MKRPAARNADQPLLAVVVLSVGGPAELAQAVRSILDQDIAVELVVINSGGGDVASRLPEHGNGIRIVTCDDLLWPGAARNRGIAATTAPFVAFLAADCIAQPGWVAGRVREHLRGAAAVASAIVNDAPGRAVSTAYHLVHTGTRDVNRPPAQAARYGASYARWMFDRYGAFREDLRVAEDTEFHMRFAREHRPEWAPDVRTIHDNPRRLLAALRQQFERGRNRGAHWADRPRHRFVQRVREEIAEQLRDLDALAPKPHPAGIKLAIALLVLANQLGRSAGRRTASSVVRLEAAARANAKAKRWRRAADNWAGAAARSADPLGALRSQATALTRAGDNDGALAIYRRLVALYPNDCSVHLSCANALLAGQHLDEALRLVELAIARLGRRLPLLQALAQVHLALGNTPAAQELYTELARTFPQTPTGPLGLSEIALSQADWSTALDHLHALGVRGDVAALVRAVELATYLGRQPLIDELMDLLRTADRLGASYVREQIDVLSARNDWAELKSVVAKYRLLIAATPTPLALTVEALNMSGQPHEALELIAEAEAATGRRYTAQRLAAHLQRGETADALIEFREHPDVHGLSVSSFTALTAAASEADSGEAADLVAKAADAGNRDALRIAAMFQSRRLESLAALGANPPRLASARCEELLAALIDDQPQQPDKQEDNAFIRSACATVSELRSTRASFAPDPMFVASDAVAVAAAIASAVRDSRPFSLLRLGDGEGNMLPYRERYAHFRKTDYAATQRVWWDRTDATDSDLEAQLRTAIDGANVLGVPDLFRLSYVMSHDVLAGTSARSRNLRGLVAAFDYGVQVPGAMLTSCHIHQALGHWGLWDILLPQFESVSLITCHPDLGPALNGLFGLEIAATYLIPPEAKHAHKFASAPAGRHYPDVFESLREPLSRVPRGHVVLVAAGVLGKIYCAWIKAAGGIALDVGSAADHWCGYNTRPAHETVAYRTPPGVRARIEELAETDPLVGSIVHLHERTLTPAS